MPILDTPITTDDKGLKKVLGQKQPAILVLHHGKIGKPLDDALKKSAKKHAGNLLVVRVDVEANPATYAKYDNPQTPALISMTPAFFGRKIKAEAEKIRPSDIRAHVAHLLDDEPLPVEKPKNQKTKNMPSQKGKPVNVTDATFRHEVLKSKKPVLVDFWATWCGPCQTIAPYVEQLSEEYKGQVKFAKLDTDRNQVMSRRFQIQSIPTFILFQGGQPVARISGANPGAIRRMVEEATEYA